jgi:hypothetical protein
MIKFADGPQDIILEKSERKFKMREKFLCCAVTSGLQLYRGHWEEKVILPIETFPDRLQSHIDPLC